jgi:hypothetical protein
MRSIAERRAKVAELLKRGLRQYQIVDALGLNKLTVSRDIKAIEQEWRDAALLDFDAAKGLQIARLDHLYGKLCIDWEKSRQPRMSVRDKERRKAKSNGHGSERDGSRGKKPEMVPYQSEHEERTD